MQTRDTVQIHQELLATSQEFSAMFGLLLPHYLLASVVMSTLSTVAVVLADGSPDGYALSCFPYLFIFFVPMCIAGQRLQDASKSVSARAYRVCPGRYAGFPAMGAIRLSS